MNYARPVHEVAEDLMGMTLRHGRTAGRIVEVEAYHEDEPACHAHIGLTARTAVLLGPPGYAYVYRSYGIHALVNIVCEEEGVGAAVLVRALEPVEGERLMRKRRAVVRDVDLTNGPGKLTQALGIGLDLNGTKLDSGPIKIEPRPADARPPEVVLGTRIGITKAVELEWRLCDATSKYVSRPFPPAMRREAGGLCRLEDATRPSYAEAPGI